MTTEGETDQNALLRNLLETLAGEEIPRAAANSENVAQLLAAAIAQVGQSILHGHGTQSSENSDGGGGGGGEEGGGGERVIDAVASSEENFPVNPQAAAVYEGLEAVPECSTFTIQDPDVVSTVEIPTTEKPRPLCIKFPIELRKRIIAMRKEGKKSKDIAKELKVSVSGVQKVWERFLATGMVHDRKPSTYAGRPRKSTYSQESSFSPGFDLSDDVFPSSASRIEYVTTPISAPPPDTPTSAVIITEDSEVFTEGALDMPGATVEIVETSPMVIPRPKSAKKKGMPAYREELLLRLVEDCPLATMRAQTDGATNPHVQNLMTSITRPLYLEYVLGHPFGKVPPPRPFEGCTSEEAQVILSDPSNPVGKQLLAELGYSTKVYFNACCKPSPLFDQDRLLSSLPISLGPSHLGESLKNVLQFLLDLCVDPEEMLKRLPTAAGPLLVARSNDTVLASHSIPAPTKLSEYWTQLYHYVGLFECCENFLSAHPPSAPCLLCHPFENFAQSLEIKDPVDEVMDPSLSLSSPPHGHPSHFTTDIHTASSEVEVQVLQTGTSGITSNTSPTMLPPRRGRGRGRKHPKTSEKQPKDSLYVEQKVVSDGEFEVPLSDQEVTEVVLSTSAIPTIGSSVEAHTHIEVSEAAKNLAFLATHVTSIARSDPNTEMERSIQSSSRGGQRSEALRERRSAGLTEPSPGSNPSMTRASSEAVSSEIVAVAEVMSSSHGAEVSRSSLAGSEGGAVERQVGDKRGVGRMVTGQTSLSQEEREMEVEDGRVDPQQLSEVTEMDSGSVRRSRRKVARVRRLVSEEAKNPSPQQTSSESPRKTPPGKKSPRTSRGKGQKKREVAVVEEMSSPPPAKRTRRSRTGQKSPLEKGGGGEEELWGGWKHPSQWGMEEVVEFVRAIPQCACCTEVFKEHEVDGESLLSLDPQMMVKLMDLKTGPALRIHRKILSLKKHFNITD